MTTFDNREKAYESKFARDEELRFKAGARRNRLLGMWAAEKLGLAGDKAAEYAASVVRADFEKPGEEDVFEKIRGDFDAAGVAQSDTQIRTAMNEFMTMAVQQLQSEG